MDYNLKKKQKKEKKCAQQKIGYLHNIIQNVMYKELYILLINVYRYIKLILYKGFEDINENSFNLRSVLCWEKRKVIVFNRMVQLYT